MTKVKVLIADDSVVYRSQIKLALSGIRGVEVVGTAVNGRLALERQLQLSADLLILDLEMPEMDGLETLRQLKAQGFSCKALMFSSVSKKGADATLEALRLGAADFITKPSAPPGEDGAADPGEKIRALLLPKIHALFPGLGSAPLAKGESGAKSKTFPAVLWNLVSPRIVVIGSSTGGPSALEKIFSRVSAPFACPVVIVQHMPPVFTASLAERLAKVNGSPAGEAKHGEVLRNGRIYVAPGDYHLRLSGNAGAVTVQLDQGPQINWVRPAVDPLFSTAADIFGNRCLGIVLTGMGADGMNGACAIKQKGGAVVIQSEKTCTVFGMPGAVHAAGAYDRVEDPEGIAAILQEKAALSGAGKPRAASGGER